jgi:hypothetical protein
MVASDQDPAGPVSLAGASAARRTMLGQLVMTFAGLGVIPIAFESDFGSAERLWGGVWLAVSFLLLAVGLVMVRLGYRRRGSEVQAGYTTEPSVFAANRDLYLLDSITGDVLLAPTLPWRSQETGRLVSSMRADQRFTADDTIAGLARARREIAHVAGEQSRVTLGNPPVRRALVIAALFAPVALLGVGLGILIHPEKSGISNGNVHSGQSTATVDHTKPETQIEVFNLVDGVVCNGGRDIKVTRVGQQFTCIAADGSQYFATITNALTGAFTVG